MKEIQLTRGQVALVDDEDYEYISQWKWTYKSGGYAYRQGRKDGKYVLVLMHRLIMNTPKGKDTDHINHNKLDNRKENLRICTRSQNCANVGILSSNTSGYRGVSFNTKRGKWKACIVRKFLGYFDTPEEASQAYNLAADEVFGEFTYKVVNK